MVKKVSKRKRVICKFASLKMKRTVNVYSAPMRDLLYLFEFNSEILKYGETEQTIFFQEEGIYKPFRFDFEIEFKDKKKQLAFINNKTTVYSESVFFLIAEKCLENVYEFNIYDGYQICQQPYLDNIKLLYRYAWQTISIEHNIAIYNCFGKKQNTTLKDFKEFLQLNNLNPTVVYTMLFHNLISTDLHQPLIDQSLLYNLMPKINLLEVQTI